MHVRNRKHLSLPQALSPSDHQEDRARVEDDIADTKHIVKIEFHTLNHTGIYVRVVVSAVERGGRFVNRRYLDEPIPILPI